MRPSHNHYLAALKGVRLPAAYIDWDLLSANAREVLRRVPHHPIRLASKSLRSVGVIKRIFAENPHAAGILAYSAREAAFLCEQGFDDIVVAYPTVEENDLEEIIPFIKAGKTICLMTDHVEQIRFANTLGKKHDVAINIAIDMDLSVKLPFIYFGVYRSPIKSLHDLAALVTQIKRMKSVKLVGLMGYEAQMSIADRDPARPLMNRVIKMLKATTSPLVAKRRQEATSYLKEAGIELHFVNGGGSATLESTVRDTSVTEVTVGSAFFGSHYFDNFSDFAVHPAAGFLLPITRLPQKGYVTCHGGGYIASGPSDLLRLPQPFLPSGLTLLKHEGAGEVQTPLKLLREHHLAIGDAVIFRHAKAGELAEHFNHFHIIQNGKLDTVVTTYRGDGHAFL